MQNRRRHLRQPVNLAVSVDAADRPGQIAVSRDLSASGMLFHSLTRFAIGERVELTFRTGTVEEVLTGRVVRATRDSAWTLFPNATAVTFESPDAR